MLNGKSRSHSPKVRSKLNVLADVLQDALSFHSPRKQGLAHLILEGKPNLCTEKGNLAILNRQISF